jgi:hypothetical protein
MSTRKTKIGSSLALAGMVGAMLMVSAGGALAGAVGLGQPGVARSESLIDNVGYRCCYWRPRPVHHHCCWHHHHHTNPYFTKLVGAGYVSYPIYRVDRYTVDMMHPSYVYNAGWGW